MSDDLHSVLRPLRIIHVFRAPLGGLFRHVLDLTREQVARGHEVGLVMDSMTGGDRAHETLMSLAPILELGILRLPIHRNPHVSDLGTLLKIHNHTQSLKADVVHGHGSKGGLYARASGFFQRAERPVRCYTPHGGSFNYIAHPIIQAAYMSAEKLLAARSDVLLFESVFIAKRFHQMVGPVRSIVRIVQNGIGASELVPVTTEANAAEFVYVGELRSAKGIDTLLEATAVLSRRRGHACKLILVGSGPDEAQLVRQAAALGIEDQVSFPGPMPARKAFALGRTLVVPSRAESLPYIVLEAAGAQMPLVATNVGGIGEVFGPYRDRLIPCDNIASLADAMESTLEMDPALVKQQSEELAAFVATRFTIPKMADAVITGYQDGLARRALPAKLFDRSFAISN